VSAVDVEAADAVAHFPKFAHAEHTEVILGPGESLFIPAGVWHYVRSLSTAFSISFWF
jgi:lysine-specific demethylase 8